MSEVLRQALLLTGWGMGMTFLSLGALAMGMYLLTVLTREKPSEPSGRPEEETGRNGIMTLEGGPLPDMEEARQRAVAAAVAVAWALAEDGRSATIRQGETTLAGDQAWNQAENQGWNSYARALQLSRRANYDARRARR